MDMGENEKFGLEKRSEDPVNYNLSSDWRLGSANFTNSQMSSIHIGNNPMALCKEDLVTGSSSRSTGPLGDSYCLPRWELQSNSHNIGFSDICVENSTTTSSTMGIGRFGPGVIRNAIDNRLDTPWNQPSSMLKEGLFLSNVPSVIPQSFSQFPTDSGFIERAARFSCFSNGNFSDMVNPFGAVMQRPQEVLTAIEKDVSLSARNGAADVSPIANERSESMSRSRDEARQGVGVSGNESDGADLSAGGRKGLGSKKRKRIIQDAKLDQVKGDPLLSCEPAMDNSELEQKGDQNPLLTTSKNTGKQSKNGSPATTEPIKEDYIHVRARRGQATNSHSLAERVRREKISERMKFLQDLVPGCSKVTGKAVMLDEIINYVQSLQRQVEFLSMKLATVNPRLDFNIESLLTKDFIQSRAGPSSSLGYSPDINMTFPQLLPSQPGLIQAGVRNPSDTFLRTISTELANMSRGYNEPTQLPNAWEDELNNVVQMGFGPSTPTGSQDLTGSHSQDHLKVEL